MNIWDLNGLKNKILNMLAIATIERIDDSAPLQEMMLQIFAGEYRDNVERLQQYGFTSVPLPGAEAATLFLNGNRDHGLVIAVDDRRYRLKGLAGGEVALYTDEGDKIHFKRGGKVVHKATAIHLGKEDPTEFVALATKTNNEHSSFVADINTLKGAVAAALGTLDSAAIAGTGYVTAFNLATSAIPHSPQSVASAKVKAE